MKNKEERTLLYGYDIRRNTWHTYIKNGEIETVKYYSEEKPEKIEVQENKDFIPNKRLYPEACDFEFSKLLKEQDVYMPFTGYQEREEKKYYGKTLN